MSMKLLTALDGAHGRPEYIVENSAWLEHGPFALWLTEQLKPKTIVELGSHAGYSYFCFCQAVKRLHLEAKCFAIDTWQGDEHAGFYSDEIFKSVSQRNTLYNHFSTLIRARFDQALEHFADGSIDLLHIDGRPYYDDVKEDFESWVPKLSPNAIVMFHDTQVREKNFGVVQFFGELKSKYKTFEFEHSHGLGLLAMGTVPEALKDLFEAQANQVRAIRKVFATSGLKLSKGYRLKRFRAYSLASILNAESQPILNICCHQNNSIIIYNLLNGVGACWIVLPKFFGRRAWINSNDMSVKLLSPSASLKAFLGGLITFRRKKYLQFDRFRLLFGGPEATRNLSIYTNKLLTRTGSRPDSQAALDYPELLIGWGDDGVSLSPCTQKTPLPAKIAIVFHIYYPETWPEMANVLKAIPYSHDLIITLPPERESLINQILADIPTTIIRVTENRGRDVRPFLTLLEDGTLAPYDYICKVHSKRSRDNDPSGNLGDICRRRTLFDLLVAPDTIKTIIQRFMADPTLGMIGSKVFHLKGRAHRRIFMRSNKSHMQRIIRELGGNPDEVEPDFFEGTMFWVRTCAFDALRDLNLSRRFLREQGAKDGAIEHAIERVFGTSVTLAGYKIDHVDALNPSTVKWQQQLPPHPKDSPGRLEEIRG